jgi:hypothetical protein
LVASHVPAAWHSSNAVQVTGVPTHRPLWHVSLWVQGSVSSHGAPSLPTGFEHVPVAGSHVPAVWHASEAEQLTESPPTHTPAWHVSVCVHAFPSLHAVPSVTGGFVHAPVVGSQVPAAWHGSLAVQVTGLLPTHTPAWHVSVRVHPFPSVHAVPFATAGFVHAPVAGSQVPTAWHGSLAVQVTGVLPVHTPAWHVSVCVHAFPSVHAVPFAAVGFEQAPVAGMHVPAVWH